MQRAARVGVAWQDAVEATRDGVRIALEVLDLVARALRVEAGAARIAGGARGAHKTVEVTGIGRTAALEALGRLRTKG